MKLSLKKTRTFSFSDETLKDESQRLVVWWYGPVIKNKQAESVPKAYIFFRILDDQDNLGGFVWRQAALTHLGLLRIGSVWQQGTSNSYLSYKKAKFDVDFSEGGWRILSLGDLKASGRSLYTECMSATYLPEDKKYKTYLIEFYLPDGKHLLVPCLEFFARCYGRSSEVKRVLATYPWEQVKKRLFEPLDTLRSPGTWPVKSTRRVHKDDVILLAHILYDPYAEMAARRVYSHLEIAFSAKHPYALPKITPWFQGEGELLVEGVPVDDGKSFLALRVLGSTHPVGATIQREREKTVLKDGEAGDNGMNGLPSRRRPGISEIIDLTDDAEPDHGSSWLDIPEDGFVVLGEPRRVIDKKRIRENETNKPSVPVPGDETTFSTGESYGSGKGVGKAFIHAPVALESQGTLRDMWNALLYLKSAYPKTIHEVSWFTFEDGFKGDSEPRLISLESFDADDKRVESATAKWVYCDVRSKVPRGVLIIRVNILGRIVYIVELQRRPRKKKEDGDGMTPREESLRGLVFTLKTQHDFESWLRKLLADVRFAKGVVQKLTGHCPGLAHAFNHSTTKNEKVPCEAAVLNALKKVGILL